MVLQERRAQRKTYLFAIFRSHVDESYEEHYVLCDYVYKSDHDFVFERIRLSYE